MLLSADSDWLRPSFLTADAFVVASGTFVQTAVSPPMLAVSSGTRFLLLSCYLHKVEFERICPWHDNVADFALNSILQRSLRETVCARL